VREGRGDLDEPVVENRARNDSGKDTNPNFCFKKGGGKGWVSVQTRKKGGKKRKDMNRIDGKC
jgi:hypothetical protein